MNDVILNNGMKMPLIGLGTWNLRGDTCSEIVELAIKLGYRLIDTAQMYDNEKEVGVGIAESVIIPSINQVEAHIYYQKWNFQNLMESNGTQMQAWAPLAQGFGHIANHPILTSIGKIYGKTAMQVALRFLVQRGISVIPKSRHESRLLENLNIFDFELPQEEMNRMKTLDCNETFFPWTKEFTI